MTSFFRFFIILNLISVVFSCSSDKKNKSENKKKIKTSQPAKNKTVSEKPKPIVKVNTPVKLPVTAAAYGFISKTDVLTLSDIMPSFKSVKSGVAFALLTDENS